MENRQEDPKEKAMRILGEASGDFVSSILLLCPASKELVEAMHHVRQAVLFARKAIEDAMNAPDE
jgi:hypothetical protein